jgi:hypothetical protein
LSFIPYTKPIIYYFNSSEEFDVNSMPINYVYFSFFNDYQRQNPFTKKDGMRFYINELKNKGYISKFIYDILIKNIEKINVMEIYYNTSMNPSLKEAQRHLTLINKKKKFSMEDLKKSITRIFREKIKNANRKNLIKNEEVKRVNELPKLVKINEDGTSESESESRKESSSENNDSLNYNININKEKNDNNKNRRNSEITKSKKLEGLNNDNEYCLTQAFTNIDNFLINQFNDPLLFSIGQGIKNVAFMDDYNDFKKLKKKSNLSKITSLDEEENGSEEGEENDANIVIHEKGEEEEEEENEYEENEEEKEEYDQNIYE